MIKKFRPIWSFDIEQTERWLSNMASKGYHLVKINFNFSIFIFSKGVPKEANYRFVFDKNFAGSLPGTLADDGWIELFCHGSWSVIVNYKPLQTVKIFPSRKGLFKRKGKLKIILGIIALYTILSAFPVVLILLVFWLTISDSFLITGPGSFWLGTLFAFVIIGFFTYLLVKGMAIDEALMLKQYQKPDGRERRVLVYSDKLIARWNFYWQHSSDKLEQWLEKMELQGYNLCQVKLGLKYLFTMNGPRRIKYCVDYQNTTDQGYFDCHREAGWKPLYTISLAGFFRWTLWAQEYSESEELPQLYSDRGDQLNLARRITLANTITLVIVLVAALLNTLSIFTVSLSKSNIDSFAWFALAVFIFAIFIYGVLAAQSWQYFFRVKKRTVKRVVN